MNQTEKFFDPHTTQTGWHKNMPKSKRRALILQAHGGDKLATARALMELHNVSTDKGTRVQAKSDSLYFFGEYHRDKQRNQRKIRLTGVSPHISQPFRRLQ